MKTVGLFAGVGGLETGLAIAGHETVLASDILPAARAVLGRQLPDVDLVGDVRELAALPDGVELVVAGFPCQDLSQAGLTRGLEGDRSGLIHEVFRLVDAAKTPWLVLENVPFMLQLSAGAAMRSIVDCLETLGYRWAWRVVDTNGFGLPHRRERVYLVASRVADPADVLMADDNPFARPRTALGELAHGFYWTEGRGGLGWAVDAVPTLKNGSSVGIPSPPAILLPDGRLVKPDIRDAERLQGFPEDWTAPAEEITRASARWALVASAVSVPVAAWLGGRLKRPGAYDRARDLPFDPVGRLPKAARFDGNVRHTVAISVDPLGQRSPPLDGFLRHEGALLSPRATAGFLARTRVAKLRFAPGFIDAVEAHYRHVAGIQIEPKRVA